MPVFKGVANKYGLSLSLLLAIASRETGMGTDTYVLANNWTGRDGHGKGIMQIDDRYHAIAQMIPADDHPANIEYAARFLSDLRKALPSKKAAIAAYNAGINGVKNVLAQGLDPDVATTGNNYAADVLRRQKMIQKETGFEFPITKAGFMQSIPALLLLSGGGGLLVEQLKTRKKQKKGT
ncbi:transglycosylase SLT domain-containing protein [Gracilimonas tropica]|uniref:transglycosylase SLT domain-containing protein n=1 Tax=Gracilimonas tropica TaxID=454600 RepID=UPI00039A6382|nr:transglycosylase SLT domain-containing protein [Gracilimonas tropica]